LIEGLIDGLICHANRQSVNYLSRPESVKRVVDRVTRTS